jgi:nitrate/nitrite-specific signal transduction histidine kinase
MAGLTSRYLCLWWYNGGNIRLTSGLNGVQVNIRKHAEASKIWLQLGNMAHGVKITVKDYAKVYGGHHSLNIMKERTEAAGGVIAIISSPGEGTEVIVELPPGEKVIL